MGAVEGVPRQSGVIGVALAHFHMRQPMAADETARLIDEMAAALEAEHRAFRPDTFAEQMQHATRPAAQIDDTFARLDADPVELRV